MSPAPPDPPVATRDVQLARLLVEMTESAHHGRVPDVEAIAREHPEDDPQSPRLEQPPLFETPADPACQAPPSEAPSSSGCPRLRTANRQQIVFRTAALDELIPLDHPARIVWDFVEGLDLSPLYDRIKAVERAPGRAPIDPKILMSFWLYATLEGIGSARQIDELCRTHDAFRWIAGDVSTNYHTLSDFRTRHVELLDKLLTDTSRC